MLNYTIYEWVGINSHPMSWPAGTGPGLYEQIVVLGYPDQVKQLKYKNLKDEGGHGVCSSRHTLYLCEYVKRNDLLFFLCN